MELLRPSSAEVKVRCTQRSTERGKMARQLVTLRSWIDLQKQEVGSPRRATWGSSRDGQEAEGVTAKSRHQSSLWFPQAGVGEGVSGLGRVRAG